MKQRTARGQARGERVLVLVLGLFAALVAIALHLQPALAQRGDLRSGSLNPFPKDDIYRLHLVGDWFVGGLAGALRTSLISQPRVQMQPATIELQSLRRSNWDQWVTSISETARSSPIDMAVVMFGVSEIGSLFTPGRQRERFGTEDWLKAYGVRVDSVMKALKSSKGAVYWIGMPIVRRRDHSDAYQIINNLLRERAYANGVTFIDSYSRFQDENGGFSRYGPDLSGANKLMRTKDGVYFTGEGNAKLAYLVMQMIRRDLSTVKSQRDVVLAGSEAEQRSIRRGQSGERRRPGDGQKNTKSSRSDAKGGRRFGEEKADNGSFIYEAEVAGQVGKINLSLPRPALSAAIMSLVTRSQSKDKLAQLGDNVVNVIEGGVPLLSTVTPADQSALALRRRRLSPTQSVFFKVWGKGERLDPKPGRADDFEWPRPQPEPVVHVTAEPKRLEKTQQTPRDPNLPPLPVPNPVR